MTDAPQPKVQSWILWYSSTSHKKDRYFVGFQKVPCLTHGFHMKAAWTYEKDGATVLDGPEGPAAKEMCEHGGYKELKLEPIDESKNPGMQEPETIPAIPVSSVH
jgi:hypothetical protein